MGYSRLDIYKNQINNIKEKQQLDELGIGDAAALGYGALGSKEGEKIGGTAGAYLGKKAGEAMGLGTLGQMATTYAGKKLGNWAQRKLTGTQQQSPQSNIPSAEDMKKIFMAMPEQEKQLFLKMITQQ